MGLDILTSLSSSSSTASTASAKVTDERVLCRRRCCTKIAVVIDSTGRMAKNTTFPVVMFTAACCAPRLHRCRCLFLFEALSVLWTPDPPTRRRRRTKYEITTENKNGYVFDAGHLFTVRHSSPRPFYPIAVHVPRCWMMRPDPNNCYDDDIDGTPCPTTRRTSQAARDSFVYSTVRQQHWRQRRHSWTERRSYSACRSQPAAAGIAGCVSSLTDLVSRLSFCGAKKE
jgi:hypothetical protein